MNFQYLFCMIIFSGIAVNSMCPGLVATEIFKKSYSFVEGYLYKFMAPILGKVTIVLSLFLGVMFNAFMNKNMFVMPTSHEAKSALSVTMPPTCKTHTHYSVIFPVLHVAIICMCKIALIELHFDTLKTNYYIILAKHTPQHSLIHQLPSAMKEIFYPIKYSLNADKKQTIHVLSSC